ncbi:hypothetical protein Tco_0010271 [Tanacetum coccineum]
MSVLPYDQMNSIINCETAKATWEDLILYHEGPSGVKESRVMDLKLCYNTFKFKEGETLTQTFTRYKALMNELVNDGVKLSKLEINTGFINRLLKKCLSFCQDLRNTNHVKDSELASLFGKLKYEENLIDNIYETEKKKSLSTATPLSTDFISTSIRNFMKELFWQNPKGSSEGGPKGSMQRQLMKLNATNVGGKVTLQEIDSQRLHSGASTSKSSMVKNKGLVAEAYEWDKENVSSDDNEMVEMKVLMALADDENVVVGKESARNGE